MTKRMMALTRSQKWNRQIKMKISKSLLSQTRSSKTITLTTNGIRRAKMITRMKLRMNTNKSSSCNRKTFQSRVSRYCLRKALKVMKKKNRSAKMVTCSRRLQMRLPKMNSLYSNWISSKMLMSKTSLK